MFFFETTKGKAGSNYCPDSPRIIVTQQEVSRPQLLFHVELGERTKFVLDLSNPFRSPVGDAYRSCYGVMP
jgi:hypothetical protein